jgi:hypothetical protein
MCVLDRLLCANPQTERTDPNAAQTSYHGRWIDCIAIIDASLTLVSSIPFARLRKDVV